MASQGSLSCRRARRSGSSVPQKHLSVTREVKKKVCTRIPGTELRACAGRDAPWQLQAGIYVASLFFGE